MTDRELMQQALDALDLHAKQYPHMVKGYTADAAEALRARLAQPEPEPVAQVQVAEDYHVHVIWTEGVNPVDLDQKYLYVAPSQSEQGCAECGKKAADGWALYCVKCSEPMREWQGLTDEEIQGLHYQIKMKGMGVYSTEDIYRAIEAKLKKKNSG